MMTPLVGVETFMALLRSIPPQAMLIVMFVAGEVARRRLWSNIEDISTEVDQLGEHHSDLRNRVERVDTKQDQLAVRQERVLDKIGANTDDIRELEIEHVRRESDRVEQRDYSANGTQSGRSDD
jgi:hypothetical protein